MIAQCAPRKFGGVDLGAIVVNPFEDAGVVIAIEIQAGAAVSGPFKIDKAQLEDMITRAIAKSAPTTSATSIH